MHLDVRPNLVLYSQQRETKDKACLLARQHSCDYWDVGMPCSVLAFDCCGVLNCFWIICCLLE